MKYEEKMRLINNIIDNEFQHLQMKEEIEFVENDEEQKELAVATRKAFEVIRNMDEENKYWKVIDDIDCAQSNEWINLCRFYFKQGVAAGLTNLNFLNDINAGRML